MRSVLKVLPLALLGLAVALLVACGDRNGLLSGAQAGNLQDALAAAQSACGAGDSGRAAVAAQSFADRVEALPPGEVDRALIQDLREGASTLESLVPRTCTGAVTTTTTTTTATTTTTPTTTATTTTTPTTPTATTPTEPTTPTPPPPDTGGDLPGDGDDDGGPGDSGGAPGDSGGAAPGQIKKALRELREGPEG